MKKSYGIEKIKSKRKSTDRLFLSSMLLLLFLTALNLGVYKEISYYKMITQEFLETIILDKKISSIYMKVDNLNSLVSQKKTLQSYMNERIGKIRKLNDLLEENSRFDQKIKRYATKLKKNEKDYQHTKDLVIAFLNYSALSKANVNQTALLSDAIFNKKVFSKLNKVNNGFIESIASFNVLQSERTELILIGNFGIVFFVIIIMVCLWLQSYFYSKFVIDNIFDPIVNNTFHLKLGKDSIEDILGNNIEIIELSSLFRSFSQANKKKNSAINSLELLNKKIKDDLNVQREFIPVVAHEFKTPLNAILGNVELVLDDNTDVYNNSQILSDIKISSEHLLSVVTNFLDYAKLDAGMYQVQKIRVNLPSFFDDIYRVIHPLALKKNTRVSFFGQETSLPLFVDSDQQMLNSVCINLIANAIRHSNDKGQVSVEVGVDNNYLYIKITDNGKGIDIDDIDNIFLPYFQLGSKDKVGTGLGLSICKKFCELLNINISVTSSPSGTNFKLLFSQTTYFEIIEYSNLSSIFNIEYIYSKLEEKEIFDSRDGNSLVFKHKGNNTIREMYSDRRDIYSIINVLSKDFNTDNIELSVDENHKILLFEDDELNIRLMERIAKNYNYEIEVLRDGKDAYSVSSIDDFDIILMDLNMPKMSGIQATKYLRNAFNKEINIYAFSANAPSEPTEFCHKNGFDGFISKPLSINKLKHILKKNTSRKTQNNQG